MEFKFLPTGDISSDTNSLLESDDEILLQHLALLFKSFPGDLPNTPYGLSPLMLVNPLSKKVVMSEYSDMINAAMISDPIIQAKVRCDVVYNSETGYITVNIFDTTTGAQLSTGVYGKNNFIDSVFEPDYNDAEELKYYNAILQYNNKSIILPNKSVKNNKILRITEPSHVDNVRVVEKNYALDENERINIFNIVFEEIKNNNYFVESIECNLNSRLIHDKMYLYLEVLELGYATIKINIVELDASEIPTINRFNISHVNNPNAVPHYNYSKIATEAFIEGLNNNQKYRVKTTNLIIKKE